MKKKIPELEPLILTEGYFSDQEYNSHDTMGKSINNWKQFCPYQLRPNILSGRHQVLQLHSMQIAFAHRKGGTMHNAGSAKNSLAVAVVEACTDKACFGRMKLQEGDIIFFDDSHPHNFIIKDSIKFSVVSIDKKQLGSQLSKFTNILGHRIHDTDTLFATTLHEIWERITNSSAKEKNSMNFKKAEEEILTVIMKLLSEQTPVIPKLTAGEKTALDIRDSVFDHMDGKFTIRTLAKEYNVSEQTLQNSFKSLFGFTPKYFFRILKLNLVHQELQKSNPKQSTVLKIASKWGFSHMGYFSKYYTELFSENPSQTLKTICCKEKNISEACVNRQEEII